MTNYLIWSNKHQGWWRQNRHGYTPVIQWAGLFGEHEAFAILDAASQGKQTHVTDRLGVYPTQVVPNEALVAVTDEGHPGGPDCPPSQQHPIIPPPHDDDAEYGAAGVTHRPIRPLFGDDATDDLYTNP